jgi:hypothetical protein
MSDTLSDRNRRKRIVLAICQEFSHRIQLAINEKIVVFVHEKWRLALEDRIRTHGWRVSENTEAETHSEFRILKLVDSYR